MLNHKEQQRLIEALAINPEIGDVIRDSGGTRKVRWAANGRGKRGGARIIYYWASSEDEIFLLFIYAKNEQDNLSKEQLRQLRRHVEEAYK